MQTNLLIIWIVGSDESPAGPDEVKNFEKLLEQGDRDQNLALVCHHAVSRLDVKMEGRHLWKLGSEERPATVDQIKDFQTKIAGLAAAAQEALQHQIVVGYPVAHESLPTASIYETQGVTVI